MSGNMYGAHGHHNRYRWQDQDSIPDTSSQYSATTSQLGKDQQRPADIGERVHSLFKCQKFTDVKFVISCGIKPKPYVLAHKAILAVGSPKFEEMLYGNADVLKETGVAVEIQINNLSFQAFSNVVEFLYTDDVYFENDKKVMDTLAAAKVLEVPSLVARCESYLESAEITEYSACTKLQVATAHNLESMKARCVQFIEENTGAVLRSPDFINSDDSIVRTICKIHKLNLRSERELFDGVIRWIQDQNEGGGVKRSLVDPFLKHIRFLTMRCNEFSQLVQKYPNIFTSEEALNIVLYLNDSSPSKSTSTLPSWCNVGTNRCLNVSGGEQRLYDPKRCSAQQKISISLKPVKSGYLSNLMCILEMKCIRGCNRVHALKLSFGKPVTPQSTINDLSITVTIEPNKFTFREHVKVHHAAEVTVPFTRPLFVRSGQTLYFHAKAAEVNNYNFLQFNEDKSFSEESPFVCSLGSVPKNQKLYFISEVIYEPSPARQKFPPKRR